MKRKWLLILGGVLIVLIGIGVWGGGRDAIATARMGTTYVAKQTCSCVFVAGRSQDSCRTDYDADTLSKLDVLVSDSSVTVSALSGLVSARAQFEQGFGCHPVN